MGTDAAISSIPQLFAKLEAEEIQYLIAGMSAAVLQGVPYTTLDTDVWINLPPRSYIRVLNLCRAAGAEIVSNTVVLLQDGSTVNFLYRVDGLNSFIDEHQAALELRWFGRMVRVLPLERILRSKTVVGRPKDLAHLPILKLFLRSRDSLR